MRSPIARGIATYPGLPPHRMEQVGTVGRVLHQRQQGDDADSTEKALSAFPGSIFWILGGKPKEGGIESLEPHFERVAKAYLIVLRARNSRARWRAGSRRSAARPSTALWPRHPSMPRCILAMARSWLLSPACASYDQYRNFEERGDAFRALGTAMPGFQPIAAPQQES